MFSTNMQSLSSNAMDAGVDLFLSFVKNEWSSSKNVEDKIQGLRQTFRSVSDRLVEAEKNLIVEGCWSLSHLRLHRLKSVYLDVDNLLDEYDTACRLEKSKSSRKRKWYETWLPTNNLRWSFSQKLNKEIHRVNQLWEEIKNDERELGPSDYAEPLQDVLWDNHHDFLGREEERDEIIRLLVSNEGQCSDSRSTIPPVVPIYGTAGIGKSTLARMVYMDPRIDTFFNSKAWVTLPSNCNATDAMKKIYEHMTAKQCDYVDMHMLSSELKSYLTRREGKYLLVIDNMWANTYEFWDTLRHPLLSGEEGCKVLITTRNKNTCRVMRAVSRSSLSGLSDEECWQLMHCLAFPQGIKDDHEHLVPIGKEIAKKCQGSPLAAKSLGLLLCGKSEEYWVNKLSEMRSLKEDRNGVLARLMVSYYHLEYHERQCLAYCCIFPHGYEFQRDQIIRSWRAEGLIQPDLNGQCQPEEVGLKYFENLVERSFFENISTSQGQVGWYRMPTLMCDLAKLVSEFEFRDLKSGSEPLLYEADQARYVSLSYQKDSPQVKIDCIGCYRNLRTFKLFPEYGDTVVPLDTIEPQLFEKITHIRVLDLSYSDLRDLPHSVGCLIHLRYLRLSNTEISTVPEELCNLINIETIELKRCLRLKRFPEGLDKLIYLCNLDFHIEWEEISDSTEVAIPQGIGKLTKLQSLSRFNVTVSTNGQGCNISALKDLNLRGDLCILNLERVPTGHAMNANLKGKKFIEKLMLRWHSSAPSDRQLQQLSEEVINLLQPHNRLRCLWIVNYPGIRFPCWMGDRSFASLETIQFSNCNNVSFLSLLGQLRWLKNLVVDHIDVDLITMPRGFPSLEHLQLLNLSSLHRFSLENEIPKLKQIDVSNCPNLLVLVIHRTLYDIFERENFPNLNVFSVPVESN